MDIFDQGERAVERNRLYGVYPALVADINDPDGQGRVKVRLPWLPDDGGGFSVWARLATLMAGANRGTWFIPDVDDEVLVAFEGGDPRRPYVVGALWNGQDTPPETMDGAGNNFIKSITSRNGVKITLDDNDGQEKMILETPGGQKLTLQDGPGKVEIVDSNGNSVTLDSGGISVVASVKVSVRASTVEVNASMVTVNAAMSKFSGVVQCDTLISNSVISATYSPGAGNIW
ncbi:MAG: type IV secretion protein Rhs [Anaerolineae bacterium]|nr:type IV secretion protein Rhs [Anaerolineae bacterium]MCB9131748.1 type IV secretion protein Rhs [Anaerolineales bacterium]MCB9141877.1 type IV secretion protein Rhs [Anaerolineales bacterium]HRX05005.1 phage baseplate assembly protein V [Anaerolineae bacterium]